MDKHIERMKGEWRDYRAGLEMYPRNETRALDDLWTRVDELAKRGGPAPAPRLFTDALLLMLFSQELALRELRVLRSGIVNGVV